MLYGGRIVVEGELVKARGGRELGSCELGGLCTETKLGHSWSGTDQGCYNKSPFHWQIERLKSSLGGTEKSLGSVIGWWCWERAVIFALDITHPLLR